MRAGRGRAERVRVQGRRAGPVARAPRAAAGRPAPLLDLKWSALQNVEYLTDGGNTWIHTAVIAGRPVVVKTLKPECQDVALAINEIEAELDIHR